MGRYKLLGCKILEREIASIVYNCKMRLMNWREIITDILMIQR